MSGHGQSPETRRGRQFEALFEDDDAFRWMLEPDGTLRRANGAALSFVDAAESSLVGEPFPELPWWAAAPDTRRRLRGGVERAGDGERVSFEVDHTGILGEALTIEFTFRPITAGGVVEAIFVEGDDITERVDLERELRDSEELHRVTLNNMTDTVLITDDEGRFTYVCPNVHFIFGYTAEEIHEMGTIDALLGADLYDPDELAETGVLTNVECVAADKAGREHALLVNVREVSIQGGTTLYSCRDVTKRKQRERALHALHGTARELLLAGTREEIARVVVEDAADVLGLPGIAVYDFDTAENVLRPADSSPAMRRLYGPLHEFDPDDGGLPTTALVSGETVTLDDPGGPALDRHPATDLHSAVAVPLGDHGVLLAGSGGTGAIDEVTRELAELLGAAAEAAFDRVARESELRERDRELQAQNRRLADLNSINEIIRGIDQALVRAETREEIEQAVCDRLTADDRLAFAWVGGVDAVSGGVSPRAWAGEERGYLDGAVTDANGSGEGGADAEPALRAGRTGEEVTVENVAADLGAAPWRREAVSRGFQSVVSVPLAYDGVTYGVLSVYAGKPAAFDETALAVLGELADTVAYAITAAERRGSLLTDGEVELEFDVADQNCVLYRLAADVGCSLALDGTSPADDGEVTAFLTVRDVAVDRLSGSLDRSVAVVDYTHLGEVDDGHRLQVRLSGPFLGTTLADHGAALRSFEVADGEATAVVEASSSVDVRAVVELLSNEYPDSRLVAKRAGGGDAAPAVDRGRLLELLTDRQREVVQSAYHGGYFESPRERTGEQLADRLGVSSQAFHQHLRIVQRKLFGALFDDPGSGVEI